MEKSISAEPDSVIDVASQKELPLDIPTKFKYYCRILCWIFQFYGINLSTAPKTLCDFASYVVLIVMNLFLLVILGFHVHLLINAIYMKEYIMLYAIIPITLAIIRPIVAYVSLLRRKNRVLDFFSSTIRTLLIEHNITPGELHCQVRKWECTLVTIFLTCYMAGFVSHTINHFVSKAADDPFHHKFVNLTDIPVDRTILFAVYWISVHAFMLELVTISGFVILCLLVTKAFEQLQTGTQGQMQVNESRGSNGKEFWKMHQRICAQVETMNVLFTPFITMSLVIQIFTICFWTRGLALSSPWMTFHYHLWVVHFLILSLMSFSLLCWSASLVNQQVYLSLRALDEHADFTYPDPNYATIKHLFYITNLNINPIQITFWNSFAINKSFVITVIGTIVTYTVALFGLN